MYYARFIIVPCCMRLGLWLTTSSARLAIRSCSTHVLPHLPTGDGFPLESWTCASTDSLGAGRLAFTGVIHALIAVNETRNAIMKSLDSRLERPDRAHRSPDALRLTGKLRSELVPL